MINKGFAPERFIDREAEQELFEELLKFQDDSRLLTIRDEGGRGKSSLLKMLTYRCGWQHDPPILASLVALDQMSDHTPFTLIMEIEKELAKSAHVFGVDSRFIRFHTLNEARVSRDFTPFRTHTLSDLTLQGASDDILSPLSNENWSAEKEEIARRACVEAFLEDLRRLCDTQPVVALMDSWERSNPILQEWIINRIVLPLCFDSDNRPDKFILVLAGRELPDFKLRLGEARYQGLVKSIESLGTWGKTT
jgi:hypothetical protein